MKKGFTIIETLVVLVIFITLMGIGYVSVVGIQRRAPIGATVNTVIGDMRGQQTKAMTGDTQTGSSADNYGIYFGPTEYVLFKGTVYNAGDPANAQTPLPDNITVTTTLPGSSVIFVKGSGDVSGYQAGADSITVTQTLTGDQKVITINRYGAATQIQ